MTGEDDDKKKRGTEEADEGDADEGDADEGDADEGDADEGDADEGDADEGDADEGDADEGDADEGDESEGDANDKLLSSLPERTKRKVAKRIGKLVGQRNALETQLEAAKEKLKNASFSDPDTRLPFPSELLDEKGLTLVKREQTLLGWKAYLRANLGGYMEGEKEVSPEQVQRQLFEISDQLDELRESTVEIKASAKKEFAEMKAVYKEWKKNGGKFSSSSGSRKPSGKPLERLDKFRRKPDSPGRGDSAAGSRRDARKSGSRFDPDAVKEGKTSYADMIRAGL